MRLSDVTMNGRQDLSKNETGIYTRLFHLFMTSLYMREICEELNLNPDIGAFIGLLHDLGTPADGHEGETHFDELFQEIGLGRFSHNIATYWHTKYFLDLENQIFSEARANKKFEKYSDEEIIEMIHPIKRLIYEMVCHNGESAKQEYSYDPSITDEEIEESFINSVANRSYLKKMKSSTAEGMVLCVVDKITSAISDFWDGCRRTGADGTLLINSQNGIYEEYIEAFKSLGISDEAIDKIEKGKVRMSVGFLAKIQFFEDLKKHFDVRKRKICFSNEVGDTLKKIKTMNMENVVLPSSKEWLFSLGRQKETLVFLYASEIMKDDTYSKFVENVSDKSNGKSSHLSIESNDVKLQKFFRRNTKYAQEIKEYIRKITSIRVKKEIDYAYDAVLNCEDEEKAIEYICVKEKEEGEAISTSVRTRAFIGKFLSMSRLPEGKNAEEFKKSFFEEIMTQIENGESKLKGTNIEGLIDDVEVYSRDKSTVEKIYNPITKDNIDSLGLLSIDDLVAVFMTSLYISSLPNHEILRWLNERNLILQSDIDSETYRYTPGENGTAMGFMEEQDQLQRSIESMRDSYTK